LSYSEATAFMSYLAESYLANRPLHVVYGFIY
jgi:hypothetical protein